MGSVNPRGVKRFFGEVRHKKHRSRFEVPRVFGGKRNGGVIGLGLRISPHTSVPRSFRNPVEGTGRWIPHLMMFFEVGYSTRRHHAKRADKESTRRELHGELATLNRPWIYWTSIKALASMGLKERRVGWHGSRGVLLSTWTQNSSGALSIFLLPLHALRSWGRPRSSFYFLGFFFAARNRVARAWSVWPTIRAGLACGIVKLKLDLAGSRKRPRLVFGRFALLQLTSIIFSCVF